MHECIDSLGECCASHGTCSDSSTISLCARDADVNALRVGLVQDLVQDQTREEPQGTVCAISISSRPLIVLVRFLQISAALLFSCSDTWQTVDCGETLRERADRERSLCTDCLLSAHHS